MAFTDSLIGYSPGALSDPPTSLRPATVVSNPGAWTVMGGSADLAAAMADEADVTFAQTPVSPSSAAMTVAPGAGTLDATKTIVSTRYRVTSNANVSILIELVELVSAAPVVRSSRTVMGGFGWSTYEWTLTSAENSSITNRSQLQGRITAGV